MIEYLKFEFSEFSFAGLLILAALLFLFFRAIKATFLTRTRQRRIAEYFPIAEVVVWLLFILWSINILLKDSLYHMIAVLALSAVIVAGLGWFVARDLIAGIVLRFSDHFNRRQKLLLENEQGTIIDAGLLALSLQKEDGSTLKIPWSKISGQVYGKGMTDESQNTLIFTIDAENRQSPEKLQDKIRQAILLTVGVALNREPKIQIVNGPKGQQQIKITAYTLNPACFSNIRNNVNNVLNEI